MTLKEFLEENKNTSIKVACKEGSNFFFCAKVGDERIENVITWRDEERKKDVEALISKRNELELKLRNVMWELDQPDSLLDREVVETYPSIINRREKIVLLAGCKNALYWDQNEFDRGYEKEVKKHE